MPDVIGYDLISVCPSGGNLAPSLGGTENFSPAKMTFFSEKIYILAGQKFLMAFFSYF